MTSPIALQLYTLRDATARDYAGTVKQVAAMGYAGVETASFAGTTVPAAAQLFKELGLTVCSAHLPLRECLSPAVFFEVDTYGPQTAGADAAAVLAELGPRAPLLHLKDGPAVQGQAMLALGEGVMDIPALLQASASHAEWLIVELDNCDTDMVEAVQRSYQYLARHGLGRGKN